MTKEQILAMFAGASLKADYTWDTYQPINVSGYERTFTQSGRKCRDRADFLIMHVRKNIPLHYKFIDWGCNYGFFVFELARHGYKVQGIDKVDKYIDICKFVNPYPIAQFIAEEMSAQSMQKHKADVALCFSVLHHLRDKASILNIFSRQYKQAYIEMDGPNFAFDYLRIYYWHLEHVGTVSDKYGSGTRTRKTWYCTNQFDGAEYCNIKSTNCLAGRAVFQKIAGNFRTIIKRENSSFKHTWIDTNLAHEAEIYRTYRESFIPNLLGYVDAKDRILEIEFIDGCSAKGAPIRDIFRWLIANNLYIIDLNPDQFIKTKAGFVLVDLESVFTLDSVNGRLKKPVKLRTYDEQITYLEKHL